MKKKKIMILGASVLQLPGILKAKEMGLEVIAVDMDRDAVGFKYADVSLEISTIDIPKVMEAALYYEIDGILTLASDMPIRTVATVAKKLNIVGLKEETALKTTNKVLMRECLKKFDVPVPDFFKVHSVADYLASVKQLPNRFIVKPSDNSGSRGVFLVNNKNDEEELLHAYKHSKNNSRVGEVIVEEYMEGPEVSVETLSINKKVYILAITDKVTTGNPNFVEMGHSQPSSLSKEIVVQIEKIAIAAVEAVGIENGPSHTEIIITNKGPKIVEIGARLGGDNITTHLVPLSTGIDMVRACIKIALGQNPEIDMSSNSAAAIRYLNFPKGEISQINGIDKAKDLEGVKHVFLNKKIGDTIEEISNSSDRVGYVIAQSKNAIDAIDICEKAIDEIKIEFDN